MERRIIINADDFGLCAGVNKAVVKAHTEGILTSATIMANMSAAEEAIKTAKQLPGLGVGVHLNLFEGRPLSKDPCVGCLLNAEGEFTMSPAKLSFLSIVRFKVRKAIRAELTAQIQWVIDHGIKPTHLDSHKHIHGFPVIFPMVCRLARQFKIGGIRYTYEPKELSKMPWPLSGKKQRKQARTIRTMAKINHLQDSSLLKTNVFLGIVHTGKIDVSFLRAVTLYNSAAISEVMTHPGFAEGLDPAKTRLVQQRKIELDALCSEKTKRYFKEAGIKLVHYGNL